MSIPFQPHPVAERDAIGDATSGAIMRLHAKYYGRGPANARTHVGDDHVLTVLEDIFTLRERTLITNGRGERVHATRAAFQDSIRDELIGAVEQITGRRVRTLLSAVHDEPELATEIFLLHPRGEPSDDAA